MNISISTYVPLNPKTTFHGTDFYGNSTNEGNTSGFICSSASPIGNLLNCLHVSLSNPAIGGLLHTGKAQRERFAKTLILHPSFTGKEKDYETGYHYFGARYYDSEALSGWLSVDSESDELPHISAYNYCENNPIILNDPDGEFPLLANCVGAIASAAVDYASQAIGNLASGNYNNATDIFTNIDWGDVVVSAAEGFVTCGGNIATKTATKTVVKGGAALVRSVADVDKDGIKVSDGGKIIRNVLYEAAGSIKGKPMNTKPKVKSANKAVQQARGRNGGTLPTPEAKKVAAKARATNAQNKACNNAVKDVSRTAKSQVTAAAVKGGEDRVGKLIK